MASSNDLLWVGVMAKAPIAGRAKTRLIPLLGAKGAARFQALCLLQTLSNLHPSTTRVRVFGTPAKRVRLFLDSQGIRTPVLAQSRGELGTRLANAFGDLFRGRSAERACLIGTDSPDLPRSILEQAGRGLHRSAAVLSPAVDGGFTLIGLRRDAFSPGTHRLEGLRALFDGVPWSSSATGTAMRTRLDRFGMSPIVLPRWWDADEPADFLRLARRFRKTPTANISVELRAFVDAVDRRGVEGAVRPMGARPAPTSTGFLSARGSVRPA